jgi:hypothetical protein
MTMFTSALAVVKRQIPGQIPGPLHTLLPEHQIAQFLHDSGHCFRQRIITPGLSVYLLLLQLLHHVSLQGLRQLHDPNLTASAICQARAKLPLPLFYHLIEQLAATLRPALGGAADSLFHGLQVVLLDGTNTRTPDTPQLAAHYGKHSNGRKRAAGYPAPKLLCLLDYATGLILRVIDLPACRQEHMVLSRLFDQLQQGQIVVADRGLVSFSFLCQLLAAKVHACLRLPLDQTVGYRRKGTPKRASGRKRAQRRKPRNRRVLQRLGPGDRLVQWSKSPTCPKACSRRAYAALPGHLTLREITFGLIGQGCRPRQITLITTLLDPVQYPAADLAALYRQRWQIEVCFRDLKCSQGLRQVRAQTLLGVRKELLAQILLYNLVRAVMLQAAARQHVAPLRISFLDALRHLRYTAHRQENYALVVNPRRIRPPEPRRVKTRRSKFPPLNQPRAYYKIHPDHPTKYAT